MFVIKLMNELQELTEELHDLVHKLTMFPHIKL